MATFDFSNISGNAAAGRFPTVVPVTTVSTTPGGVTFTNPFSTTITTTFGNNPIVLTSSLTGAGLAGDTMVFTLTATSTFYNMAFNDIGDRFTLEASPGTAGQTATYLLTFTDGSGQNVLTDPIADLANFTAGEAMWITAGGSQAVQDNVQFIGEVTGMKFVTSSDVRLTSLSGTPTCFAKGTRIAVPGGERNVEDLAIGDTVVTHDGETRDVLWIGRQSFDTTTGVPEHLRPVRIQAGVFGDGLPHRDLVVTADHALLVDEVLVNASALVNGETIAFDTPRRIGPRLTVYHVETADHAIILAEGAPAETFVDIPGRRAFDNHQEYLDLYSTERIIPEIDRPRITSRRQVPDAIKERLGILDEVIDFDQPLSA